MSPCTLRYYFRDKTSVLRLDVYTLTHIKVEREK